MSTYRFTGTGEAKSTTDNRAAADAVVRLTPDRVELLIAADHGIIVGDPDSALVWRDETLHPSYAGPDATRRHVTGPVQLLEQAGWLERDPDRVYRLTTAAQQALAGEVR